MAKEFFEQLNYSASNEDGHSERQYLNIGNSDRLLTITGSGSRALDLLLDAPELVVSIDINHAQNHLLYLKMACYKHLDYQTFIEFIGLQNSSPSSRNRIYRSIRGELNSETKKYWDQQIHVLEKGVIYSGTWEVFLAILAKLAKFRSTLLKRVFASRDVNEQYRLWKDRWDNYLWKSALYMCSRRFVWTHLLKEPGINFVSLEKNIYQHLYGSFDHAAKTFLLRDNSFANLMLYGTYMSEKSLPIHLQMKNFSKLKETVERCQPVTSPLDQYLAANKCKSKFNGFSLSDFSSYADLDRYRSVWNAVVHASKPEARVCERQFLVNYDPIQFLGGVLTRERSRELAIAKNDSTFIYSFVCATVH